MTPSGTVPQYPIVNAGELYLNGLQLSMNVLDVTKIINVAPGAARDSKNINDIVLQVPTALRTDRSGLNGLDTGFYASDMLYAIYIIGSSTHKVSASQDVSPYPVGALLSREFVRPYLPVGYDMFRRVGAVLTDSTGDIVPFVQVGNDTRRTMRIGSSDYPLLTFGNATDWTLIDTNAVSGFPIMPFLATNIYISTTYTSVDTADAFYFQPTGQPDAAFYFAGEAPAINEPYSIDVVTQTNDNGSFNYELDDNAGSLSIIFRGYDDLL